MKRADANKWQFKKFIQRLKQNPLIKLLRKDGWFRWLALAMLVTILGAGLMLPKVWRVTPDEIPHPTKISGVDFVQAFALRRSALKHEAAGNAFESLVAWEMARANNPGDAELSRGVIRSKMSQTNAPSALRGFNDGAWLLILSRTNQADLELVAKWYAHCQLDRELVALLETRPAPLSPTLLSAYLKSLLNQGQITKFAETWERSKPDVVSDPELGLYHQAYLAGWGPVAEQQRAASALAEQSNTPGSLQVRASKLRLLVGMQMRSTKEVAAALQILEGTKKDTVRDHLLFWRLLASAGEREDLIRFMTASSLQPSTPSETLVWADLWLEVGKDAELEKLLKWSAEKQAVEPGVCVRHGKLLIRQKRWEDLAGLGSSMRLRGGSDLGVVSFGYYLEAKAAYALGRASTLKESLDALLALDAVVAEFAPMMGEGLVEMGYGSAAVKVLKRSESMWAKSTPYWNTLCLAADQARDEATLLTAAKQAYQVEPNNPVVANNYANALLVTRTQASEALEITRRLLQSNPNSLTYLINHASALLLNHRAAEAKSLLVNLRTERLTRAEASQYAIALCELWVELGEPGLASEALEKVDRKTLFPKQSLWLSSVLDKIGKRG